MRRTRHDHLHGSFPCQCRSQIGRCPAIQKQPRQAAPPRPLPDGRNAGAAFSLSLTYLLPTPLLPLSAASVLVPSENGYKEKTMQDKNVDFCGILNLLAALKRAGFPKTELEQVAVRIAVQTGATIPISF